MCILIVRVDVGVELVFWSRDDVAIYVHRDASPTFADNEIRAILTDLGAPATVGPRYICYCGDPIPQTPGLIAATAPTTNPHTAVREALRYGA